MDIEPEEVNLKRKPNVEDIGTKKKKIEQQQPAYMPMKMPEGPRIRYYKEIVTKTYMDAKGRLITEDVEENREEIITGPEPTRPSQIIGFKKGTQAGMSSFLVKSK